VNKHLAHELQRFADELARRFSRQDREGNFNKETFAVSEIIPMSDATATLIFKKDTGKKAAFFCYYISKGMSAGWKYFVPTDAHILGMVSFAYYKLEVERGNYAANFEQRHLTTPLK
jgi:hypothetical protein